MKGKIFSDVLIIFFAIIVTIVLQVNNNGVMIYNKYAYGQNIPSEEPISFKKWYEENQHKLQYVNISEGLGVKITSPIQGQNVTVGDLNISGTSSDNSTTDCQVYADVNDIKPFQNVTARGIGGQRDYSNWTYTYTNKYHLITEGVNELTAKLSCKDNINNALNSTQINAKWYSINVTGIMPKSVIESNKTGPNAIPQPVIESNKTGPNAIPQPVIESNQTGPNAIPQPVIESNKTGPNAIPQPVIESNQIGPNAIPQPVIESNKTGPETAGTEKHISLSPDERREDTAEQQEQGSEKKSI